VVESERSGTAEVDLCSVISYICGSVLETTKLGCVRGDRRLFSGLDFSAPPGTLLQVTGPNGSGKTSLLRILCRLLAPAEGSVTWQGENIRSLGEEYFTSVTYLGHRHGVKDELSAIENLRVSNALNGIDVSKERARSVLERMGLAGRESLPARLLSEGQRRRVALARLILCDTKLWLLDEVMTSLDKGAVALVRSLIEEHLAGGGIAIVATHQELELAAGLSKRLELAT
jgi:heme exporter protein A